MWPLRPLLPVLAAALAVAACLPAELEVEGRQLLEGREIEKPTFIDIEGELWVTAEVRTSRGFPPAAGSYDLWRVSFEDGRRHKVIGNVSDREGWRPQELRGIPIRYFMVDERSSGSPFGSDAPVATLARVDHTRGELERIPDVSSYSLAGGRSFFYRRAIPEARLPELHFRNEAGMDRNLGPVAGAHQLMRGGIYFVVGEDRVLSRIASFDAPVETLRRNVTRFLLRDDEQVAIISVVEGGKSRTLLFDLVNRQERALPGMNPCCWQPFAGQQFTYSEAATAGAPGKLHHYDIALDQDVVLTLPPGLQDVSGIVGRPRSDHRLFFDSRGRVAQYRPAEGVVRLLDLRPVSPLFTNDGQYLLYIDAEVQGAQPEGRLMIQSADFDGPPRQLSPRGSLVQQNSFFFLDDDQDQGKKILVFWAHFGRDASDLYFGDHLTGEHRVVAEGISEVTVTPRRVLGIVRVSQQDLVGDLVKRDITDGTEQILAYRVADAAFFETHWLDEASQEEVSETRVAFVIRDRIGTRRDGLWTRLLVSRTPAP